MKNKRVLFGVPLLLGLSIFQAHAGHDPLPVKKKFNVNAVTALKSLYEGLTENEKKLTFHLQNAGRAGRDLIFFQSHRHALLMKEVFEKALNDQNFETTRVEIFGDTEAGAQAFREFMTYVGMFEDQGGPYLNSNRKVILNQVTADQVGALFARFAPSAPAATVSEIQRLLTDKEYEVIQRAEDSKSEDLVFSGGNIYQKGITGPELEAALAAGLKIDLNCQVVKELQTGRISCFRLTTQSDGIAGQALQNVVRELEAAYPYALSDHQRGEIEAFVRYFRTGDQDEFRNANIHWVRDRTNSKIDFMIGFVEVYQDHKGSVGSWESMVQFVDPSTTEQSKLLATRAQYFENHMPYGQWKKTFPADYSPPAMMVYYFQEIASMHSGGYNLPNFDDLRNDPTVGAKNVIKLPLPGEMEKPETLRRFVEYYSAFGRPERAEELAGKFALQRKVLVLLHEIIGHGSGTYDPAKYAEKEDPISALGALGSALEEQRADLAALVFAGDPVLAQIGIYRDATQAMEIRNAMYDIYLIDFLGWIVKQRSFAEPHTRGHWLLINRLLAQGKGGAAVEWASQNPNEAMTLDNQVLVVKNYDRFWEVCRDLLAELQDIKANRKVDQLEQIMAQDAPLDEIKAPWAQTVIKRGENLRINFANFDQAWTITPDLRFQVLGEPTLEDLSKNWSKMNY